MTMVTTYEEAFAIERDPAVPDSALNGAGKIRRRLFRGEMIDMPTALAMGVTHSIMTVTILAMKRLGFEFDITRRREGRVTFAEYRLVDPDYQPTPAALEANRAESRKESQRKRDEAKARKSQALSPAGWVTAAEAAAIMGTDDPDRVGKAWRAGRIVHRKRHPRNPRAYLYDRAEIEALPKFGPPQTTVIEEAPDDNELTPGATIVLRFLATSGPLVDARGFASQPVKNHLVRSGYHHGTVSVACRELERAGFVERDLNSKRTYRIEITNAGRAWVRAHPEAAEPEPSPNLSDAVTVAPSSTAIGKLGAATPNGAMDLPTLPVLGGGVTVYALVLNDDDSITMGLRNGEASWQVDVIGATKREP
jgi:hypothetical protein